MFLVASVCVAIHYTKSCERIAVKFIEGSWVVKETSDLILVTIRFTMLTVQLEIWPFFCLTNYVRSLMQFLG